MEKIHQLDEYKKNKTRMQLETLQKKTALNTRKTSKANLMCK